MSRSIPRIGLSLLPLRNLGGTGVYTEQLLRVLESKGKTTGLEFVPIVPEGFSAPIGEFPTVRAASVARLRFPFRLGSSWTTGNLFEGMDAVHYPTGVGPPVSAPPLIATIHDVSPFLCPETMPFKRAVYLRRMFSNLASTSRKILADTEWQADRIREVFPAVRDKIRVVYPVIDPLYFQGMGEDNMPEAARGKTYLLAVGTLEPRKNLIPLIESWRRSEFNADLILVGTWGWKYRSVQQTLAKVASRESSEPDAESWRLPDGRAIYRLSDVEKPGLAALYGNAVALVSASLFEGFGLPVAEAMASGRPVIVPRDTATAEVAGKSAWFFDPGDRDSLGTVLRNIATQESERRMRIEYGKSRAKMFSDEPFLEQLTHAYKESINSLLAE